MNEVVQSKKKKYKFFIGIDISKNELDFAVLENKSFLFHKEIENNEVAISAFLKELKEISGFKVLNALFCMEATGFYSNHLRVCLKRIRANFVLEDALRIKNSMGLIRGKHDKIDAIRIAQFVQKNKDEVKLWVDVRPVMAQLNNLSALRDRLVNVKNILKTPIDEQGDFISKELHLLTVMSCKKSLDAICAELDLIDSKINLLFRGDEHLQMLVELITSVPAVGKVTATQIIICTNEFRDINDPKKFASYAGVAPFKMESGKMVRRPRVSSHADKKMKSLLHMCALSTLRKSGELKEYFDRKTKQEKKPGMSVINAIRNKLILRIFACVNQRRPYQRDYQQIVLGHHMQAEQCDPIQVTALP